MTTPLDEDYGEESSDLLVGLASTKGLFLPDGSTPIRLRGET